MPSPSRRARARGAARRAAADRAARPVPDRQAATLPETPPSSRCARRRREQARGHADPIVSSTRSARARLRDLGAHRTHRRFESTLHHGSRGRAPRDWACRTSPCSAPTRSEASRSPIAHLRRRTPQRPHATGRATSTADAPSASAFSTSVPRRNPPSISTGTLPTGRLDDRRQVENRRGVGASEQTAVVREHDAAGAVLQGLLAPADDS